MSLAQWSRKLRRSTPLGGVWGIVRPAVLEIQRRIAPRGKTITLNSTVKMQVDPAVYLNHPTRPTYESEYFHTFLDSIQAGDTVYDVGANQGLFTIAAAQRVGESGKVLAFDCAPASIRLLNKHVQLNNMEPRVEVMATLIGKQIGEATFNAAPSAAGWASAVSGNEKTTQIAVECTTLDHLTATHKVPNIIKIDVEGYELNVLEGARDLLTNHSPKVFCALHPELLKVLGQTPEQLLEFMRQLEYSSEPIGEIDLSRNCEFVFTRDHDS